MYGDSYELQAGFPFVGASWHSIDFDIYAYMCMYIYIYLYVYTSLRYSSHIYVSLYTYRYKYIYSCTLCVFLCLFSCPLILATIADLPNRCTIQSTNCPPTTDHRCRNKMPRLHLLRPAVRAKGFASCDCDMCCNDIRPYARAISSGAGCPSSRRSWLDPCSL